MTPSPADVTAITAVQDPVIRNLRITECYHRLAVALRLRTGDGANWPVFAVWASRQAGATIRGEDFLDQLARILNRPADYKSPLRSLWRAILRRGLFNRNTALGRLVHAIHTPFDAFERASAAVAKGNLMVFEEIGLEIARYLDSCPKDALVNSVLFQDFLGGLRSGPPPEGQDLLKQAFSRFQQAAFEAVPAVHAQMILLANIEIGLHEQTRLQSQITKAMDAAPDTAGDLKQRILRAFPGSAVVRMLVAPLAWAGHRIRTFAREVTRTVISECLMALKMPDAVLALGQNLDRPAPPSLQTFDLPDLKEAAARFEPNGDACPDCGASDWSELPQRMHYILHLFRVYHAEDAVFQPPFPEDAVRRIEEGRVPDTGI